MDLATNEQTRSQRRSLRRAVRIEADVLGDGWDCSVPLLATNLSPEGLWLESDLPLEIGDEVLVSLRPPRWMAEEPLRALAEVTRVGLYRRKREARKSGMGLRFRDMSSADADSLDMALRGLPPPLPKADPRKRVIEIERPSIDEVFGLPDLVLADGRRFVFRAEAALLTAGRGAEPVQHTTLPQTLELVPKALVLAKHSLSSAHRVSSPMSAIFDRSAARVRLVGSVAC